MDPQKHHSSRRGWVQGICQIDWSCVFVIIALGIATASVQKAPAVQRPIYTGDATIAYPHFPNNSVPFWTAVVVPAVILLLSAIVLELVVLKSQGRGQAWMTLLNVVLALLASLAATGFLTELFKRICGRLRPDFLARCQPQPAEGVVVYGTWPEVTCTADFEVNDGHLSFPSGHASCSMVAGLFGALYVLWAVHVRGGRDLLSPLSAVQNGSLCMRAWLRAEVLRLVVMLVVLFQLAWPWGVAVSRFRDNRHNVSDVVGGILLGSCFAPLFLARLAWHVAGWQQLQQEQQAGLQLQLSNTAALPMALPPVNSGLGNSNGNGHSIGMGNMHH